MGISLDYTHCLATAIGATHGLLQDELGTMLGKFPTTHHAVERLYTQGASALGSIAQHDPAPVAALVRAHRSAWDDVVVFGSGGSVRTPQAIVRTLTHRHANDLSAKARGGPRLHFLAHADPGATADLLEAVDAKRTLFICCSRSGATQDTLALLLVIAAHLKRKAGKSAVAGQLIVVTDPTGPLANWTAAEKAVLLPQPGNLAGRCAVVGPATLLCAGLAGIPITALLAGAAAADKRNRTPDAKTSPAAMHAIIHYVLSRRRRKTVHATWAVPERLGHIANWYRHVLAVSLGKMNNRQGKAVHVGPGPETAVAAGDLHGQLQLYSEGPFDKVVTFLAVRAPPPAVPVPVAALPAAQGIAGNDLRHLADHAHRVAEEILTSSGRPTCTLTIDDLDPAHVAGLCHTLLHGVVLSAEFYGVDPFDQPGVDAARAGCWALLGRTGYDDRAKRLADLRAKPRMTT
jgi:glucose-6-phosphate isomerase